VYNGVQILEPVCTSKGVAHKIRFDVSKMRYVSWENSKRLIYGSLLCLSKDKFETFILATVEERKAYELREVIVGRVNYDTRRNVVSSKSCRKQ
jgi:hypothetical protein